MCMDEWSAFLQGDGSDEWDVVYVYGNGRECNWSNSKRGVSRGDSVLLPRQNPRPCAGPPSGASSCEFGERVGCQVGVCQVGAWSGARGDLYDDRWTDGDGKECDWKPVG